MALRERSRVEPAREVAPSEPRRRRSAWLPLGLALAAVVLALIGAVGPAKHTHARYAWPGTLPAAHPDKLWYTPLLTSRQGPEELTATLPCAPGTALPGATTPALVLGTTRPPSSDGLAVVRERGNLVVRLDGRTLTSISAPSSGGASCAYRLHMGGGSWSLTGPNTSRNGSLGHMPSFVGLFSALDLRSRGAPSVEVTTYVHSARTRPHQAIAWTLSVLAAIAALALLFPLRRLHLPRRLPRVELVDVAVTLLLLGWWIIGPAFFDDGWVAARQRNFAASGGFSAYYSSFGVNLPLDYWLEWVEHWLAQSTSALLVLRIPALLCLLATWILVRTLARGLDAAARWALACAFAVGALAWGMTFRPEPVLALLVTGVLACTARFVARESVPALVVAAMLAVLALTAHPAGIVALAPLLAAGPQIATWARAHVAAAATIGAAAVAPLIVLATVGSDLQQRRADVSSLRAFGDETAGWRDELSRYTFLSQAPYGTPLRRASVALIVLAVLAYLLRRRDRAGALPTRALGISLLLLFLTPTKWPWHFGALIGLAALAVAAEVARLRGDESSSSHRWALRPLLVLGAATAAAAWSWNPRTAWGDLDLRTLHWTLGFESRLTLSKVGGALPFLLLVALLLVEVVRRRRGLGAATWRAAAWSVPVVTVPLLAFTVAVLLADTAKTSSWTLARQNVDTLKGDLRCGLANDAVVPARASMRPLASRTRAVPPPAWLPQAPVPGVAPFTLAPGGHSQWFSLTASQRAGFFLAGTPASSEALQLEWARRDGGVTKMLGAAGVAGNVSTDARPDLSYWRFYAAGDLPAAPAGANAVRFSLVSDGRPGTAIGLTPPVTYRDESLATMLERSAPVLALPNLLLYVPCVRQPRVVDTVDVPQAIVAFRDTMWPVGTGTSPFDGVTSLYPLVRLPLSDSSDPPGEVAIYEVDSRIDGAAIVPARRTG